MQRTTRRAIFILVFSEFLVCLGISLVIPVMPFIKNELHLTATDMGIMTSLFALTQFIASPIIGRVSDQFGRKPVLVIGLFLYMLSEFLFAITNYLWMFDISRIVGGLSAAMVVPTAMAMAADITTKRQRAKVIGWLSAAFSGGLILGPGLGGLLAKIDYKAPFWVAGVLGLLSMFAMIAMLPKQDALPHNVEEKQHESTKQGWAAAKYLLLSRPVVLLFIMILVSSFGLQGFESIYSIYVNEVFKFSLNDIAIVLTFNGLISLFFQVVLFDRMVLWLNETRLIRYNFFLSFAGTIWIMVAHTKIEVMIATLIVFTAFDLLRPAITTMLTKISPNNQGLINGLNMSLTSVGNVIGPIISGSLLDWNYHYPYMVVAVFLIVSFFTTYSIKQRT